jgi:hypothetical protein
MTTAAPSTALATIQPAFTVHRADIESFARDLEVRGRARATVTRRLCTIAGSANTRSKKNSSSTHLPRTSAVRGVDYESYAVALDRNEFGARLGSARRPSIR